MQYISTYNSPLGPILIATDKGGLTGLWFRNQKYFALSLDESAIEKETEFSKLAKEWLDLYFQGIIPNIKIPLHFNGSSFQKEVWHILLTIPYGSLTTYGDIAKSLAKSKGIKRMSAQAVGAAIAKNPISIIVPCHRVVGSNGKLTGYAGGLDKKIELLKIEKIAIENEVTYDSKSK